MKIHTQSVFDPWPLPDNSVQAIITSPPYYSLRKYKIPDVIIGGDKNCNHKWHQHKVGLLHENRNNMTGTQEECHKKTGAAYIKKYDDSKAGHCTLCGAWQGQHGLEPTYLLYIAHCKLWMQQAMRVLKDDGIIFVNLADSYASSGGASRHKGYSDPKYPNGRDGEFDEPTSNLQPNIKPKSKLLIPERFVIMCVDELGLIARNNICWHSTNKMPESAEDRFSKKWEYVFMFVKNPDYYFDLDAVREPHKTISIERLKRARSNNHKYINMDEQINQGLNYGLNKPRPNQNNVHFYKGGNNIGREENLCAELNSKGKNPGDVWEIPTQPSKFQHYAMFPQKLVQRMVLCSTRPDDIVLDPFCGSGTTLKVAEEHNRQGIGIDLGYQEIQKKRLHAIQKNLNL